MLKSAKFHTKNLSGLVLGSGLLNVFCFLAQASATTLEFSTYLGSSGIDYALSIEVDLTGNCYVTGETYANDFPTTAGAFDTSYNDFDAFITKLNASGSSLAFSTFLGGYFAYDRGYSLSVDGSGNCYVTGYTRSSDFPTTVGAFDTSQNGYSDAFVTKLNSSGNSLEFSTYLGGSSDDWGNSLSFDGSGNCYVTGYSSSDFPTTVGAFDASYNGTHDAFVTKLNSSGSSLVFSSYLGGSGNDHGRSISVGVSDNCYVTGSTQSSDFPTTTGALDTSYNGGTYDAFVSKLNSSGSSLEFSSYLGGSGSDYNSSLCIDVSGNCYIIGKTPSNDFPTTVGVFDTSHNGNDDTFVTMINSNGSSLDYSTYLGGSSDDFGNSISVDVSGNCYIIGQTTSTDFPTTTGALDTSYNGGTYDAFVSKLNSSGSSLEFSSYLGGSGNDHGRSISVGVSDNCYVTGSTQSSNFPTTSGAFDTSWNESSDAFVTKFDLFTGIKEQNNLAKDFQLNPNFPNPFNPSTTISYTLAKANEVRLEVYNTKGELVRTLVSEKQSTGSHSSNWDGKDERGNSVSSGVYFCKLTAGSFSQTNKMILLK